MRSSSGMLPNTGIPSTRTAFPSLVCVSSIVSPSLSTLATRICIAETAQIRSVCLTAFARYGGAIFVSTALASGSSAASPSSSSTRIVPSGRVRKSTSVPATSGASAVTNVSQWRARGGRPAPASAPAAESNCRRKATTGSSGAGGGASSAESAGCSCRPASRSRRSFRVSPRRKNRMLQTLLRLDQPVAALTAAIDDVHLVGVGVSEDEEVVPDQLELEHGLLGGHRLDRELLRPDDLRLFGHRDSFVGCLP